MDHPQTPRILAPHLSAFQHKIVRVLGKVVQLRGDTAIIDADGQIEISLNRVSVFSCSFFFELQVFDWFHTRSVSRSSCSHITMASHYSTSQNLPCYTILRNTCSFSSHANLHHYLIPHLICNHITHLFQTHTHSESGMKHTAFEGHPASRA